MTPRKLTQTGFYISFLASAAFNVYGTMLATPNPVAWVFSVLWSGIAFVSIEIMIKVKFPARQKGKRYPWNWVRFGGVGAVSMISFGISYTHIFHAMQSWNQGTVAAILAPFAIDGFLALTSVTLMILPAPRKRAPRKAPVRKLKAA